MLFCKGCASLKKLELYLPYLAGSGVSLIFGLSFLFTKEALNSLSTIFLLSFRFILAALVLTVLRLTGVIKLNYKNKPFKELLILAFFQPIAYFTFETIGIKLTSASEAGIMVALIPIVVTILAAIFLKERPGKMQLVYILVSVAGVIFIVLMSGDLEGSGHILGILPLFGAVLSGGIYNILSRKLSVKYTPLEITYVMMWSGAIVFSICAAFSGSVNGNLGTYVASLSLINTIVPILYLGILSSVCAFFMLNYMLSKLPATNSTVFSNLGTVTTILAGVSIRHEALYWFQAVGGFLIILGVGGTNHYKSQQEMPTQHTQSI